VIAGLSLGADPPLTSIDMSLEGVGRKAAELLLAAIDGEPAYGLTTVPCRLIIRASSGPHAAPAKSPARVG
jgi:LacI family transcriptional regulator